MVFYDYCVPAKQFKKIVLPVATFAEHVFLQNGTRASDYDVVDRAEKIRLEKFPDSFCVLVTFDEGFSRDAKDHPALNTTIHVINAPPSNTNSLNIQRAEECVRLLASLRVKLVLGKKPKKFSWNNPF